MPGHDFCGAHSGFKKVIERNTKDVGTIFEKLDGILTRQKVVLAMLVVSLVGVIATFVVVVITNGKP